MKKMTLFFLMCICFVTSVNAQNPNAETLGRYKIPARRTINLPDINGMKVLKCDFHIHTVNSDGNVHALVRLEEAWEEGLDAIAITEHIAHTAGAKDENLSYNQAIEQARRKGITLIKGGEMTYTMAPGPGHANALFVTDLNKLQTANWRTAFSEAKAQGAFIQWNHPGWGVEHILWHPEHQELYEKGMLNGIEVFCEMEYYPVAVDWCYDKNLTMIANTDTHEAQVRLYDFSKMKHRPMTFVVAKDNSEEAIKEAMFKGRTIAYYFGRLTGHKELVEPLVKNSIELLLPHYKKDGQNYHRIINKSDLDFIFKMKNPVKGAPNEITLPGRAEMEIILADGINNVEYEVQNVIIGKMSEKLVIRLF